jgi:hypothetical protein
MKKVARAFAFISALCLWASSSLAQGIPGVSLVPLGSCQLTPTAATGLSSCSGAWKNSGGTTGGIPVGANAVVIRVDTQAARYTDDGVVVPSSTAGNPILVVDPPLYYQGTLSNLQFIQQTSGAKVDVLFYRVPQ